MRKNNRSNVLLVEILIAVLFFMLSATVLVQVFVTARNLTVRAGVETRALAEAQNLAEVLYAADASEEALTGLGFDSAHGVWTKDYGDYTLYVALRETEAGAGTMAEGDVRAYYNLRNVEQARQEGDELFSLPFARYREE